MARDGWNRLAAASLLLGGLLCGGSYGTTAFKSSGAFASWHILLGLAFGGANALIGILLWKNHRTAPFFAIFAFAVQTLAVTVVPQFRFVALAGPELQLIIATTGFGIRAGFGGAIIAIPFAPDGTLTALETILDIGFSYAPQPIAQSTVTFGLNLAAFLLCGVLYQVRRKDARAEPDV